MNEGYFWGVNIDINGKTFYEKDILISTESKLKEKCENYDEILNNLNVIKENSLNFVTNIIESNPQIKAHVNKKNDNEEIIDDDNLNELKDEI